MSHKFSLAALALVGALTLAGCSSPAPGSTPAAGASAATPTQEQPKPAVLSGEWVQEGGGDSTQAATVTAESISIDWVNAKDGTTAVYWVGSFVAPTKAGDFTWTSTRDEAATATALLASTDPSKEFTYSSDKISYDVTMMGVTKTFTLVRK